MVGECFQKLPAKKLLKVVFFLYIHLCYHSQDTGGIVLGETYSHRQQMEGGNSMERAGSRKTDIDIESYRHGGLPFWNASPMSHIVCVICGAMPIHLSSAVQPSLLSPN